MQHKTETRIVVEPAEDIAGDIELLARVVEAALLPHRLSQIGPHSPLPQLVIEPAEEL